MLITPNMSLFLVPGLMASIAGVMSIFAAPARSEPGVFCAEMAAKSGEPLPNPSMTVPTNTATLNRSFWRPGNCEITDGSPTKHSQAQSGRMAAVEHPRHTACATGSPPRLRGYLDGPSRQLG